MLFRSGETGEQVRCVAAPIYDYTGTVVAAVSISGPQVRVTPSRVPELSEAIRWASRAISQKLGHFDE